VADIEVDVHLWIHRDLLVANNGVLFPSNNIHFDRAANNHSAVLNPANPDVRRSFESFKIISSWLYPNDAPRNQAFESSTTWYSVVGTVDSSTSPSHLTGPLFPIIRLAKISRATKHSAAKLLVSLHWSSAW
jgi:hypothetical protein